MSRVAKIIVQYEWIIGIALAPLLLFPTPTSSIALLVIPVLWICRKFSTGVFFDRTPLNVLVFALICMVLVSVFATPDVSFSLAKISGVIFGIALFYGVVHYCVTRKKFELGLGLFILGGVGIAIFSIISTWWPNKILAFAEILERLPILIRGLPGAEGGLHPNEIAGTLLWVVPLLWALAFVNFQDYSFEVFNGRVAGKAVRMFLLLSAASVTVIIILTIQSRIYRAGGFCSYSGDVVGGEQEEFEGPGFPAYWGRHNRFGNRNWSWCF